MASKKANVTPKKKAANKVAKKAAKKSAGKGTTKKVAKKAAKKSAGKETTKKVAKKAAGKEVAGKEITATITLTGEPAELKANVEEIIEAAKKVVEKELRKQIKKA